jgi:hypothetical protein
MKSHVLYYPALVVAALGAALPPLSLIVGLLRTAVVYPMTLVAAAMTATLFLRMLFDPRCRRGIDTANAQMRGDTPWPSTRRPRFSDPQWGLFGTRYGDQPLQALRAVLLLELIVALLLGRGGRIDLLALTGASFSVTVMLSLIHLGLNTEFRIT